MSIYFNANIFIYLFKIIVPDNTVDSLKDDEISYTFAYLSINLRVVTAGGKYRASHIRRISEFIL
jgi:hypothetical protein